MEEMCCNLRNALNSLKDRAEIAKQIVSGMNFLHSLNPPILVTKVSLFLVQVLRM